MLDFEDEVNESGEFERQDDQFRQWVSLDPGSEFPVEAGRYHLYVSLACPWAHRTIIFRKLKKLEGQIGMTVVDPLRDDRGWAFREGSGHTSDPVNHFHFLSEAYLASDSGFSDRVTVPVLWDKKNKRIVNNSEDDIVRMFNSVFSQLAGSDLDFYPSALRADIDAMNEFIYPRINNGVYRAGFATTQSAYNTAVRRLFSALDRLESHLATHSYMVGDQITEADWKLFTTLIRFDPVYHGHFKCNIRRLIDYPKLYGYLQKLYQYEGIAETVNFDHIKRHYYMTHTDINPTGIVPLGPENGLLASQTLA
jgi:glutathionyl-hydroquinone reductase